MGLLTDGWLALRCDRNNENVCIQNSTSCQYGTEPGRNSDNQPERAWISVGGADVYHGKIGTFARLVGHYDHHKQPLSLQDKVPSSRLGAIIPVLSALASLLRVISSGISPFLTSTD